MTETKNEHQKGGKNTMIRYSDFTSFKREMESEQQIFDIRSIPMKVEIEQLQEDNCDNSFKLGVLEKQLTKLKEENDDFRERLKKYEVLEIGLTKMKEENDDFRERLKKYENRILDLENIIGDKIWEAKCELSNQILKCELTENHYSLKLKRFEDKLEDQFLYMKKYIENNENSFMKLFGVIVGASWGLILMALFQIFLFHR